MKTSLASVSENSTVVDAARLLRDKEVGSLLVSDSTGKTYGIVTERDLVTKALAMGKIDLKVKDICTKKLITISVDADLTAAAQLLGERNIKRLAVIDKGKIVGIVSQKDLISISPSLYSSISSQEETGAKLKTY